MKWQKSEKELFRDSVMDGLVINKGVVVDETSTSVRGHFYQSFLFADVENNLFALQWLYFLLVRLLSKIQNHLQPIQKFWHKNNSLYLWIEGIVGKLWEHIFLFSFELSLTLRYLWKVFHKYDRETRSSSLNLLLQRWINLQKFPAKISSSILALE